MHLLVGGRQKKSIAYEFGISPAASRSIVRASWKKTRARSLSELVRRAIASGTASGSA
jgi:FixJ family two-component response regulator